MIRAILIISLLLPATLAAQEIIIAPIEDEIIETEVVEEVLTLGGVVTETQEKVKTAPGARLRGLDKVSGAIVDLTPKVGETVTLGWLKVSLGDCRYPVDNPTGDAYAWLSIQEREEPEPVFEGWMVASSPALSALDHTRYDVWVLGCTTE